MLKPSIEKLKKEIISYGIFSEEMVLRSITGLTSRNSLDLEQVIKKDEMEANQRELMIDEDCANAIAQFQPKAKELRMLLAILKMNNDLERICDHAVNIAQSADFIIRRPPINSSCQLSDMAKIAIEMLKLALNSFITENKEEASKVCLRDAEVDKILSLIYEDIKQTMSRDSATIDRSLHLLRIGRNLERIADLSTNLAEETIYMIEGRVIRHIINHRTEFNQ